MVKPTIRLWSLSVFRRVTQILCFCLTLVTKRITLSVFHIQLFRDRDLAHFSSSPFQILSHFVTRFAIATKKCKNM